MIWIVGAAIHKVVDSSSAMQYSWVVYIVAGRQSVAASVALLAPAGRAMYVVDFVHNIPWLVVGHRPRFTSEVASPGCIVEATSKSDTGSIDL